MFESTFLFLSFFEEKKSSIFVNMKQLLNYDEIKPKFKAFKVVVFFFQKIYCYVFINSILFTSELIFISSQKGYVDIHA